MKLKFQATKELTSYEATDVFAYDGNIVDVAPHRGMQLLKVYPRNFFEIGPPFLPNIGAKRPDSLNTISPPSASSEEYQPPLHTPLTLADITVLVINYWPDNFKTHLLRCLPEEVEFLPLENIKNVYWTSAAKALNRSICFASNNIVMCAHGDLILGEKWWDNFIYHEARLNEWGALGISGWNFKNKLVWGNSSLEPQRVQCLDENCVILNRKTINKYKLTFDEKTFTSWHLFAADFCLQCEIKELPIYVMPGVCNHEGLAFSTVKGFVDQRNKGLKVLKAKWKGKIDNINIGLDLGISK